MLEAALPDHIETGVVVARLAELAVHRSPVERRQVCTPQEVAEVGGRKEEVRASSVHGGLRRAFDPGWYAGRDCGERTWGV